MNTVEKTGVSFMVIGVAVSVFDDMLAIGFSLLMVAFFIGLLTKRSETRTAALCLAVVGFFLLLVSEAVFPEAQGFSVVGSSATVFSAGLILFFLGKEMPDE